MHEISRTTYTTKLTKSLLNLSNLLNFLNSKRQKCNFSDKLFKYSGVDEIIHINMYDPILARSFTLITISNEKSPN